MRSGGDVLVHVVSGCEATRGAWSKAIRAGGFRVAQTALWQSALNRERADFEVVFTDTTTLRWSEAGEFHEPCGSRTMALLGSLCFCDVLKAWDVFDFVGPAPGEPAQWALLVQLLIRSRARTEGKSLPLPSIENIVSRYRLSAKQRDLLRCALEGLNNDEAASELGCARQTVATHWNRIFKKVGCRSQRDVISTVLMVGGAAAPGENCEICDNRVVVNLKR
ncbi:MAG: helix-turn-helix transcriptional regulator [Polyangiaceae bacterium]|nr:helix-turn-helix transcriptional regulator [Polyangiaceae bacterium]